jgi:deazaflavin-dependent oxidoreductase (nitroreductase family)
MNAVMKAMLRAPGVQRLVGRAFALITVTGRRTGTRYTTPVSYDRQDDTVTIVTKVVRTWWRNLEVNPGVELRLAGRQYTGNARVSIDDPTALSALLAFLEHRPSDVRMYGISMTDDGRPDERQARQVLPHVVVITVTLDRPTSA